MEKVSFDGEMDRITTANTIEDKDMVRVDSCGQMEKLMTGIMWMINEPERSIPLARRFDLRRFIFQR